MLLFPPETYIDDSCVRAPHTHTLLTRVCVHHRCTQCPHVCVYHTHTLVSPGSAGDRRDAACDWLARARLGGVPRLQHPLQAGAGTSAAQPLVHRQPCGEGEAGWVGLGAVGRVGCVRLGCVGQVGCVRLGWVLWVRWVV